MSATDPRTDAAKEAVLAELVGSESDWALYIGSMEGDTLSIHAARTARSVLAAADAVDTRVQQLTELLCRIWGTHHDWMQHGGTLSFCAKGNCPEIRAVLAEVDASQEPAAVSGMTERKQW